jgi:molybdenum cofactor cytidylyltransferase
MTEPCAAGLGVTILAAGLSSRMGRPKMLLPWAGTSVLGHLIAQWQRLGAHEITVVCAIGDSSIDAELDRLSFPSGGRILNPSPEAGMFSSIQCAARWPGWDRASVTHLAIVLGDQPHLREQTLRSLIAFCAEHPNRICLPRQGGHRRHPVILPIGFLSGLAEAPQTNLRDFLDATKSNTAILESDDPGLALDLDHPEDYQRAVREYGG